jgi:hypothetical protein
MDRAITVAFWVCPAREMLRSLVAFGQCRESQPLNVVDAAMSIRGNVGLSVRVQRVQRVQPWLRHGGVSDWEHIHH